MVRLILEKQYPEDDEKENRYTRSSAIFNKWIEDEVLVKDKQPRVLHIQAGICS